MRNLKFYILILTVLAMAACGQKFKLSITDNEDKGVKEILEFYGGHCKYAVGSSVSTDKGKKKYFEVEMSKSEAIEKYSDRAALPGSNVAYLFYRNLKDEKKNYDEIRTVILLNDGSKTEFKFSTDKLELVEQKMSMVNKVVDVLKAKNFEGIRPLLAQDTLIKYDKNELITNLEKVDPQFGTIKEFIPLGFRFIQLADGREVLHLSGVLSRDKQNNEFSVDIDLSSTKEEILGLYYKL